MKRFDLLAETYDGDFSHRQNDEDRPQTIKKILSEIERIWTENKAERFLQLVYCLQRKYSEENDNYGEVNSDNGKIGYDLFFAEDEHFLRFLESQRTTNFSNEMMYCSANPGDAFLASTFLRKEHFSLSVNLCCGQSSFWKRNGAYIIGVQNDYSDRPNCDNLFAMSISDKPEIISDNDKIILSAKQIEGIRNFITMNKQDLMNMIDEIEVYPKKLFGNIIKI